VARADARVARAVSGHPNLAENSAPSTVRSERLPGRFQAFAPTVPGLTAALGLAPPIRLNGGPALSAAAATRSRRPLDDTDVLCGCGDVSIPVVGHRPLDDTDVLCRDVSSPSVDARDHFSPAPSDGAPSSAAARRGGRGAQQAHCDHRRRRERNLRSTHPRRARLHQRHHSGERDARRRQGGRLRA
jgi:hypothetical protein